MNELLKEALLACDSFSAYHRQLVQIARRTDKKRVKSKELDQLYERLAKHVEKVRELRKQLAESN